MPEASGGKPPYGGGEHGESVTRVALNPEQAAALKRDLGIDAAALEVRRHAGNFLSAVVVLCW